MTLTRRTLTQNALAASALIGAVAAPAIVRAQDPFAEAKAYSEAKRGVSLLIRKAGRTLHESYAGGGGAARGWELASGTKSFCGVLAAAMVQDGTLTLDEACAETLTEWRSDDAKASIRIRDLLTLTGGVGGGELGRPSPYAQSVAAPLAARPRTRFIYGPAPFQVFGEIVRRKLVAAGEAGDVLAFMQRRVLTPFGVTPVSWRKRDGQPTMPSGAQVTARDWAAFGAAVMAGGNGRLDAPTLAACFEGTTINPGYGLTWWLLRPGLVPPSPRSGVETSGVSARADVRMAAGAGDQRLYLVPERDLVIARQATGILQALRGRRRGVAWSDREFLELLLS